MCNHRTQKWLSQPCIPKSFALCFCEMVLTNTFYHCKNSLPFPDGVSVEGESQEGWVVLRQRKEGQSLWGLLALFWRHSTSSGKQETLWNLNQQARTGQGSKGTLGAPSCHLPSMALGPPEVLHDLYDLGSSSFLSENGRPSFWVGRNKASNPTVCLWETGLQLHLFKFSANSFHCQSEGLVFLKSS